MRFRKSFRYNNKKFFVYLFVFVLLAGITLGYSSLTANLKIEGTVQMDNSSWDVYFNNIAPLDGSVMATTAPIISDKTNISFAAKIDNAGDYYGFTVDVVNDGTFDAMIDSFTITPVLTDEQKNYFSYNVTYSDGVAIANKQKLAKNTTQTFKVLFKYKTQEDVDLYPEEDVNFTFNFGINYVQADSTAIDKPVPSFSDASWDTIVTAYNSGNTEWLEEAMDNGTTREVQLDMDNDGTAETTAHLRIANLSTPAECSTTGFSQTACGLVLEFADVITTHRMNPFVEGDTTTIGVNSKGGWEKSDMRAYLNSTTYAYENTDYSTSGIYNALPSDLRNKIIDTKVVSGHNKNDTENFTTADKIYLFSTKEVWGKEGTSNVINYDSAEAETRQLDYYKAKGVTTSNYSEAIKMNLSGSSAYWWLRSARSNYYGSFFLVNGDGNWSNDSSTRGVSPAFRIG